MPVKAREDRHSCTRSPISGRAMLAALVSLGLLATGSEALAYKVAIQASLSGGGEVPRNDSKAQGQMVGTLDTDTNTLEWSVTYKGIVTPVIGAHFHGPVSYMGSTSEENAPIQIGTPGSLASPFHGLAQIGETQAKDLKDGRYYFNVHSKEFPAGEIRGPVTLR